MKIDELNADTLIEIYLDKINLLLNNYMHLLKELTNTS